MNGKLYLRVTCNCLCYVCYVASLSESIKVFMKNVLVLASIMFAVTSTSRKMLMILVYNSRRREIHCVSNSFVRLDFKISVC